MSRPVKLRKVGFIPKHKLFIPDGVGKCQNDTILLKHEELEAMRLKDIENLHQEKCANIMDVSRQTFQLIIDSARNKVTNALVNGKSLKIEGGNFTKTNCKKRCNGCGKVYEDMNNKDQANLGIIKSHCSKCKHQNQHL